MEINLPKTILSNEIGYTSLIEIYNKCLKTNGSIVFINFQNVVFIEGNLCSILGCIIERLKKNNCIIHVIGLKQTVCELITKNNFLPYHFDFKKINDIYNTTVMYKNFHKDDSDDEYESYIYNELINKSDFPSMSDNLTIKIIENIFEIFVNAKTHGKCEYIHCCGQYFPNRSNKPLNFTVVDLGQNIMDNVNLTKNKNFTACEAIEWAMIEGNTTKLNEPGGLGLSIIMKFIRHNLGKFEVISSNGYYKFSEGTIKTLSLKLPFPGTIVNFTFNLNDQNSYYI